jgi:hypothetical protein
MKENPNSIEEFFEETVMYYMENIKRRNVCSEGCKYSPKSTKNKISEGCAIGRYLVPEHALEVDKKEPDNISVKTLLKKYPQYIPDWMKSFDVLFLTRVQTFHDDGYYWDGNNGLDSKGILEIKSIRDRFNLNLSDNFKQYVFSRTGSSL